MAYAALGKSVCIWPKLWLKNFRQSLQEIEAIISARVFLATRFCGLYCRSFVPLIPAGNPNNLWTRRFGVQSLFGHQEHLLYLIFALRQKRGVIAPSDTRVKLRNDARLIFNRIFCLHDQILRLVGSCRKAVEAMIRVRRLFIPCSAKPVENRLYDVAHQIAMQDTDLLP